MTTLVLTRALSNTSSDNDGKRQDLIPVAAGYCAKQCGAGKAEECAEKSNAGNKARRRAR
jgi:hypothetical protein